MQEGNLWEQAREALAGIVDISNQYGSKGADIHFMHVDDYAPDMQVIVFARSMRTLIETIVHVVEGRCSFLVQPNPARRHVSYIYTHGNAILTYFQAKTPRLV